MAEWIYLLHPLRENFAETMTEEEQGVWRTHFAMLKEMHAAGTLVIAGPTLGPINTGISVFEAPDEAAAHSIMENDPCVAGGYARGELRPFRVVAAMRS